MSTNIDNAIFACGQRLLIVPGKYVDPILGKSRLLRSDDMGSKEYVEKIVVVNAADEGNRIRDLLESRRSLKNDYLWHAEEFKVHRDWKCCGSVTKITAYFESFEANLENMLGSLPTGAKGFEDKLLMKLMKSCLDGMEALEAIDSYHGHLCPKFIGYTSSMGFNGRFVVAENQFEKEDLIDKPLKTRLPREIFASPEGFELLSQEKAYTSPGHRLITSDVFSLGMIMLKCSTGCDTRLCYDSTLKLFDHALLKSYFSMLESTRNTSIPVFVELVRQMLKTNPADRPSFKYLKRIMDKDYSEVKTYFEPEYPLWHHQAERRQHYAKTVTNNATTATKYGKGGVVHKNFIVDLDNSHISDQNTNTNFPNPALIIREQRRVPGKRDSGRQTPFPYFPINQLTPANSLDFPQTRIEQQHKLASNSATFNQPLTNYVGYHAAQAVQYQPLPTKIGNYKPTYPGTGSREFTVTEERYVPIFPVYFAKN